MSTAALGPSPAPVDTAQPAVASEAEQEDLPMGALAATIATFLASHLNVFAWQRRLGFATSEATFRLLPDRPQRRPDVAFIPYERWVPQPGSEDPPAWNVVPTLTVEVVSPNDVITELEEKLRDYFDAGVRLVWVLNPTLRRVYVYESFTQVRILQENDELDGGPALPGFRLRIADLFAALALPQ
jgi:Uma2 family endonuclease